LAAGAPKSFNERPPAERIVRRQQRSAKRRQVVWQFAIGTRVHVADKRGDRVLKIASVEMIEGPLLAPLDIFVSRHLNSQGTFHFASPTDDCFQ
jgi:hypothetical protein